MKGKEGLGVNTWAQIQSHLKAVVRLTLPGLGFFFCKSHRRAFMFAVQAEDELTFLHGANS